MHLNENLRRAEECINTAVGRSKVDLVVLPECFNSPYGIQYFEQFAEKIPNGKTCRMLSETAKKHDIYLVGGTIPEKERGSFYNTCTVWNRKGNYVGKFRKMHLFDMNIPGKLQFKESAVLKGGKELFTFQVDNTVKAGVGVCYDLRFNEMAMVYRQRGCELLVYPSAFNAATGPLHWELLIRSRALDSQCYMCAISPARNKDGYLSYGHTAVVDPWGQIVKMLGDGEDILYETLDFKKCEEFRQFISVYKHKRKDVYEVVDKKPPKNTNKNETKC